MSERVSGRVGLIHTTVRAVGPVLRVLSRELPDAEVVNFVDESLLIDFREVGAMSSVVRYKSLLLAKRAEEAGCSAVLSTCSTQSPVIASVRPFVKIPVLEIDRDMLADVARKARRVLLVSTASSVLDSVVATLESACSENGIRVPELFRYPVKDAAAKLRTSEEDFFKAIATAVEPEGDSVDGIVLCQVSIAGALDYLPQGLREKTWVAPPFAVRKLKQVLMTECI